MSRKQVLKLYSVAVLLLLFTFTPSFADVIDSLPPDAKQQKILDSDNLKISGYTQIQYRNIENDDIESRFMIRRGRVKFTYDYKNVSLVMNPDMNEKKISLRDAYIKISDPWLDAFSLLFGIRPVPFDFELDRSSSMRESPERTIMNESLFPGVRDLGLYLNAKVPEKCKLHGLAFDFGVINGVANILPEFDSNKDFVERLSYNRSVNDDKLSFGVGISNFHGGHKIGNLADFQFNSQLKRFDYSSDTANHNRLAERNYIGADVQISFKLKYAGTTTLRAEYTQGTQPGPSDHSLTPEKSPDVDIYQRKFNGAYFYFVQDIGKLPLQIVAKYDWYDQNSQISGKEIGVNGTNTGTGDIRYDTYGFGLLFHLNKHVKLTGYYEIVKNESTSITGFENDVDDNRTTIRLQFKF